MASQRAKPAQEPRAAEGLVRRFDLRARAQADAAAGHPAQDARDLTEAERDIAAAVAQDHAALENRRAAARASAEHALSSARPIPPDLTAPIVQARLAMRQAEGRLAHDYGETATRARRAAADLDGFRRSHGLRRGAVYPDSRVLQAGLLLCAAVFEALFSAALFAEDDARGLLGGAITAIGLSGANVIVGFLAGFLGLRYLQHRHIATKIAGALAFASLAGVALFLNFFAAIWRQNIAADVPAGDAGGFLAQAFSLTAPQAIILLMLGGGVWVFAALKGYSGFDDPYPDYGKLARAADEAAADLSDQRADMRTALEAPINDARDALTAQLDAMRTSLGAMNSAYDEAARTMADLDEDARRLDDAATAAIQFYRQENTAARATPAPAYFADLPPHAGPSEDALATCGAMLSAARDALSQAQTIANTGLESLLAELDAAQARLDGAAP